MQQELLELFLLTFSHISIRQNIPELVNDLPNPSVLPFEKYREESDIRNFFLFLFVRPSVFNREK